MLAVGTFETGERLCNSSLGQAEIELQRSFENVYAIYLWRRA